MSGSVKRADAIVRTYVQWGYDSLRARLGTRLGTFRAFLVLASAGCFAVPILGRPGGWDSPTTWAAAIALAFVPGAMALQHLLIENRMQSGGSNEALDRASIHRADKAIIRPFLLVQVGCLVYWMVRGSYAPGAVQAAALWAGYALAIAWTYAVEIRTTPDTEVDDP